MQASPGCQDPLSSISYVGIDSVCSIFIINEVYKHVKLKTRLQLQALDGLPLY